VPKMVSMNLNIFSILKICVELLKLPVKFSDIDFLGLLNRSLIAFCLNSFTLSDLIQSHFLENFPLYHITLNNLLMSHCIYDGFPFLIYFQTVSHYIRCFLCHFILFCNDAFFCHKLQI
jgi:hypothetical protein